MPREAIQSVEGLRRYLRQEAPFLGAVDGESNSMDALLPGGFPKGAITALTGVSGTGRMSMVAQLLAEKTKEGPVAWIDGASTLYPPALSAMGVRLERLLMVRSTKERSVFAAEQIVASGAFDVVVLSGLDEVLTPHRTRRLQMATENSKVMTLFVLAPKAAAQITNASLKLRLSRRRDAIMVEVVKDRAGRAGKRALVKRSSDLLMCA